MPNRYYESGENRAVKVGDLFATIARRYDLINDLQSFGLHRLWKQRLTHLAGPKSGERALDVCCGTGDVAFALAGRGAHVVAFTTSESKRQDAEALGAHEVVVSRDAAAMAARAKTLDRRRTGAPDSK